MAELRRRRDDQQWILDYLVMSTGRDRNFGVEHELWPAGTAKSHRMVPRVMLQVGQRLEALAEVSDRRGDAQTASRVYYKAAQAYRTAQHAIMADIPQKRWLYDRLLHCFARICELLPTPVEKVEIPWRDTTIPGLFYHLGDGVPRPTALFLPGMDVTKEDVPNPTDNVFTQRGLNVLVIDGPGQGECNLRDIRVTDDNYEQAASSAIDWLAARPEVDASRLGLVGFSMGSFWAGRTAALVGDRVRALVSALGCYGPKDYIFEMASPHFKQQFMYMAGIDDEDAFDEMARAMTLEGYGSRITCPTLLCSGEFDPLNPLEDTYDFFDELGGGKELWVIGDEAHRLHWVAGLGGMSVWNWCLDWLVSALNGDYSGSHNREVYVEGGGKGPFADDAPAPAWRTWYDGAGRMPAAAEMTNGRA